MQSKRTSRTLALTIAIFALSSVAQAGDEEAVRSVYDQYREAVLANAGETAAALMSQESIAYHENWRELALDGTRDVLKQQLLVEQNQVLLLRVRMTREELETLSGRKFVAHLVSSGWIGLPGTAQATLGKIEVKATEAFGQNVLGERAGPLDYFYFAKEEGGWRIDPAYSQKRGERSLRSMLGGQDPDLFVMNIVKSLSEKPVTDSIWEPLRKDTGGRLEGHSTIPKT